MFYCITSHLQLIKGVEICQVPAEKRIKWSLWITLTQNLDPEVLLNLANLLNIINEVEEDLTNQHVFKQQR